MTRQRAFKRLVRERMRQRSIGYTAARAELLASAADGKGSDVSTNDMTEETIPFLRATDAAASARWYRRLGFRQEWEHRFGPEFPLMIAVARGGRAGTRLHLSEHLGDAPGPALVYIRVADVDAIAAELDVEVVDNGWAREVHLTDPDGNLLRLGTPTPPTTPTHEFAYGDPDEEPDPADP